MSERRHITRWIVTALLMGALVLPMTAHGQDSGEPRRVGVHAPVIEAQHARIDSLKAAHEEAEAAYLLARQRLQDAELGAAGVDSAAVGPMLLVGSVETVARVKPYFDAAWQRIAAVAEGVDALRRFTFIVLDNEPRRMIGELAPPHRIVQVGGMSDSRVAAVAYGELMHVLSENFAPSIQEWAGRAPYRGGHYPRERTYRHLMVAPSGIAARCTAGDDAACVKALGLDDSVAHWTSLYTGAELRALATRVRNAETNPRVRSCTDGTDSACYEFWRHEQGARPPLPHDLRSSLLAFVIERRGDQALRALLHQDSTAGAARVLESAWGAPVENLVAKWRGDAFQADRAESGSMLAESLATLGWLAFFGALATRSTRWRLG